MGLDKKFDINALALSDGRSYNIPKLKDESPSDYRIRLAGELRRQGKVIEAHEVFSGRRFDDPEAKDGGAMNGIFGAMAQVLNGKEYSPHDPQRQVDNDVIAGIVVRNRDRSDEALLKLFGALGIDAGMDLLTSQYKKDKKY